jgi:hypothetical protein
MRVRHLLLALPLLAGWLPPPAAAAVDVSVGVSVPGVQIGIHVPAYPELQPVPAYPVYYAPGLPANYFFYDGLYWVYVNDSWYSSSWYDGPWYLAEPALVPVYILRVPVRYYRLPPPYFSAWAPAEPPRWGAHWGPSWEARHRGWDQWDRRAVPPPAPLPVYQRQYTGDRYPSREQQHAIREQQYRFQPRDAAVRERLAVETRQEARRNDSPRAGAPLPPRPQAQAQQPPQRDARRQQEDQGEQQQQARQQQQQAQERQQQMQQRQAREQQAHVRQQQEQQVRQAQRQQQEQMQMRQAQQQRDQHARQERERPAQQQPQQEQAERRVQRPQRQPERDSPREGNNGG